MKWMDRPCVTKVDRGNVFEMDRQNKCQKIKKPLKWKIFKKIFRQVLECAAFPFFGTLSVYPFHRHLLYLFLGHLVHPTISLTIPLFQIQWDMPRISTQYPHCLWQKHVWNPSVTVLHPGKPTSPSSAPNGRVLGLLVLFVVIMLMVVVMVVVLIVLIVLLVVV